MRLSTDQLTKIPQKVWDIMARIEAAPGNPRVYLVGGAVRDLILNHELEDFDLASSLRPNELHQLLPDLPILDTGLAHGTVTIRFGGSNFEHTTFRSEGPYLDQRRPSYVEFTDQLITDLARRDFTINAMALSSKGDLIDPYGGLKDLNSGIIRTVGKPEERFQEDALRLMRALRFANRYNFTLEKETEEAIRAEAKALSKISRERIAQEFLKILDDRPQGIEDLYHLGLLEVIFPEIAACFSCEQETKWHLYNVGRHSIKTAEYKEGRSFRLAALLHDIGKPQCKTIDEQGVAHFYGHAEHSADLAKEILRMLFIPKSEQKTIVRVIALHDYTSKKPAKIARLVRRESTAVLALLMELKRADIKAQSPVDYERKLALIEVQESLIKNFLAGPHRLQDLALDGRDLYDLGYRGKAIAERLDELLAFVMEDPSRNLRDRLLERAAKML